MPDQQGVRLLLLGATGAVGRQLLRLALEDTRVGCVVAPTRKPLPAHVELLNPVVDFNELPEHAPYWQADVVICALGTTLKAAGSKAAFVAVDRDLPLQLATYCRAAGAKAFVLNSSLGAKLGNNLYLNTKAELEAAIGALGYPSYTIVRPSLIDTEREVARPGETLALWAARCLRLLIPRRYRAVKPAAIAHAMLDAALRTEPGTTILESEQLQQ